MNRTPPRPLRRELRREVYYSCPICNNPLLTYHHIVPWRQEKHFRKQDMIALCYAHARMADSNAISRARLYNLKANPPRRRRVRDKFFIDDWERFVLAVADRSVLFENCFIALEVEGRTILGFTREFDRPALFVDIRDAADRHLLLIKENDWLVNVSDVWDCEVTGNQIRVRDSSRKYYVSYKVDAEVSQVALDFRLSTHGEEFAADKNGLHLGGIHHTWKNLRFRNMGTVFSVHRDTAGKWKATIFKPPPANAETRS